MADIAPELLDEVERLFRWKILSDPELKSLTEKINAGTASLIDLNKYSQKIGDHLSSAFLSCIKQENLPDGRMYFNIADRVVAPMLRESNDMIQRVAVIVQNAINKKAGIGLKAIKPDIDDEKITNLVQKVADAEQFDEAKWLLDEPVKLNNIDVVDTFIKANAEFQDKAGLKVTVKRTVVARCCEWCSNVAGTYEGSWPDDVWRRHERCRCVIEYTPAKGRREYLSSRGRSWR